MEENKIRKAPRKKRANFLHDVLESRRLLSTVSWNVGVNGAWSTAADWSGGVVPGSGDDVVISHSGNPQITLTGSTTVKSLSITGDSLNVSSGTLTVSSTFNNSGTVTVNPSAQLNITGAYTETSSGKLTLAQGSFGSGVGTNLLGGSGFESPALGTSGNTNTVPDVWGQWGQSYVSKATAYSGAQSLLQYGSNSGVYQSFAVSPGVSYSASVEALNPTTGGLTGSQGAFLNISFSDLNGNTISSPSQFITALNSQSVTGTWINTVTNLTAPTGAASINIYLQVGPYTGISGTAGGSVYWDNILVGPTAISSAAVTAASAFNSGTITIGAGDTITTTGAFTQTMTGILNPQLGGPAAGNYFGAVNAGSAALAGTLKVSTVNSYSPSLNDGFGLLNYGSESGSFSNYQLPSGSLYTFQPGVNPTYVGISAVAPILTTAINAASTTTTATTNLIGVNLALWDGYLNTTQTQQMVSAAGLSLLRFPGGSGSDDYHFNVQNNYGYSSNTVPQFAQFISAVGATGMVTTNYGTGSPQEAEAELAYLEGSPTDTTVIGNGIEWSDSANAWQNVNWQTVGYWAGLRVGKPLATDDGLNFMRINQTAPYTNIKYWEMGNEEYGSWEDDNHGTAAPGGVSTGSQHDPATYAKFAAAFSLFDAADTQLPQVSVGIDSSDPTGSGDGNWTRNVVADMYAYGAVPGYISDHSYVQQQGSENDSYLLNGTVSNPANISDWSVRYSDYKAMLAQVVGSTNAAGVKVMATEFNSNAGVEGKQMTSLVNGLFIADSVGSLLNSGYSGGLVWDLRNGWTSNGNNSPTLYGWRQGGDEGLIGSYNYVPAPSTGPYVPYPNYFGEQLASKIIQSGGRDVSTTSSYAEMTVYSVLEPNGHLDLMVLNKNPDATLTEQFNISGFTPSGSAQLWQYGEAQDYAQSKSTDGSASLYNASISLALSGSNFSYTFPAYSMSVIDLAPRLSVATSASATPSPVSAGAVSLSAFGLENGSDNGLTYTWSATGPSTVSYAGNTNGTNAAKNITGNFTQAGVYTFLVTITDPSGQTVTSSTQAALPNIASQNGSTLTINLNNLAPISVSASGSTVTVTQNSYQVSYSLIGAVVVNGSATNNVLNFNGPITAAFTFTNGGTTTLDVNSGTLTIAAASGSVINPQLFSTVNIAAGAGLVLAPASSQAGRTLLNTQYLTMAGTTGNLDLNGNDLEVQNGNLLIINGLLQLGSAGGNWQGSSGILSSTAAADTTHLTTLGVILNTVDGTASGAALFNSANLFDGTSPPSTAVLVKYTYYGDVNLDGKVDGSDYGRVDNGFLNNSLGWFNGDLNNDNVVNGSDYTLIDNAFNTQGAALSAVLASSTKLAVSNADNRGALPMPAYVPTAVFSPGPPLAVSNLPWIDKVLEDLRSSN